VTASQEEPIPGSAAAESDPLGRGPSSRVRLLIRFIALSAIGGLLFVFHGISLHLTPWSQAIINGIVKYSYRTTGQDDTTVVLFREENLRDLNESYPVSYRSHADVLEALAAYKPRAVFVDFAFVDRRSKAEIDQLSEAICTLAKAHTSVYLALPPPLPGQTESSPIAPELLACATPVSARRDTDYGTSGVLTYDRGEKTRTGLLPSPAFAMAPKGLGVKPDDAQAMEVVWGNGVAPLNLKWMTCEAESPFSHLFHVLRHDPMSVKLRCPYTRTISVAQLLGSSSDPDIQAALEGRAVFYGAAFQLTGDRVTSPVYEELPGVYLHAMAYDNLKTFGSHYKRAYRETVILSLSGRHIVVSLTAIVDALLLLFTVAILLLVETPLAPVTKLRDQLARVASPVERFALGAAALLVALGVAMPKTLPTVLLSLVPLLVVAAVVHLAPVVVERPSSVPRDFLRGGAWGLVIIVASVSAFLAIDRRLGLDAALLLVLLPAYFLYKVLIARDILFVATSVLLIVASLVAFWLLDLGPRNVIAYVAFFEVARHLIAHAREAAEKYEALRKEHRAPSAWGLSARGLGALDWMFKLC
jgi:CHASE2 domain-containing sensor protein